MDKQYKTNRNEVGSKKCNLYLKRKRQSKKMTIKGGLNTGSTFRTMIN